MTGYRKSSPGERMKTVFCCEDTEDGWIEGKRSFLLGEFQLVVCETCYAVIFEGIVSDMLGDMGEKLGQQIRMGVMKGIRK